MLLVGETGTGKTTVCQMTALMRGQRLHILNCNQHTETSDFLGGFRPARHVLLQCLTGTCEWKQHPHHSSHQYFPGLTCLHRRAAHNACLRWSSALHHLRS